MIYFPDAMLKELSQFDQEKGGRRWFSDDHFDLIVWLGEEASFSGFQLCYDKHREEHALTWSRKCGYRHERVDDGEANPGKNLSPILVQDGACPLETIIADFASRCLEIDADITSFILDRLNRYQLPDNGKP